MILNQNGYMPLFGKPKNLTGVYIHNNENNILSFSDEGFITINFDDFYVFNGFNNKKSEWFILWYYYGDYVLFHEDFIKKISIIDYTNNKK